MPASRAADAAPKILSIPDDQFKQIQLIKKAGDTTDLSRADGKWQIVQPKPLARRPGFGHLAGNFAFLAGIRSGD